FLIGDRMRVNQILLNLLSNAVKFTPSGGSIFFTIEQTAIKNNKVFIRFIVADNGIGMTKEFQEKLFMPFEQQDASIAQKYGGSGIGLSITKNLTTMMNGIIEVESKQGEGSTFRVELPFILDTSAVKSDMTSQDFSHLNALIVDDEQSACEYMSILLQRCGVRCQYALSGKIAVEMVSKAYQTNQAFNLCLMDWEMPDMGGVETVKHIRECAGGDMPIIIVTAYDFSAIEEPAKEAGVNLFISKPLFQSTMFDLLVDTYGKYQVFHSEQENDNYNFVGKRLLLAEDNEMNREIAIDILMQYGFEVDCAENGQEAVEIFTKAQAGTYAAILMDIQMPVLNGHQATKAIRQSSHPEAQSIPVIAMTANAFSEDIAASHGAGMNDHISKPIDVDQMLEILKRHIH
ncbi:MAG: response regulator, partial [Clostridiales bacterium]